MPQTAADFGPALAHLRVGAELEQHRGGVEAAVVGIRIEHAVGDDPRRPAERVDDVQLRAFLDQQFDDVVGAAVRGAVERRVAVGVDGVDVVAGLDADLDGLEGFLVAARALAHLPNPDAGGGHQRGGAFFSRNRRIGAVGQEQAHVRDVAKLRRLQERRRANPVQDVACAVARLARHSRIRVRALLQQLLREIEAVEATGRHRRRQAVLDGWTPGPRELVQRRPAEAVAVRIGAAFEQFGGELEVGVDDGDLQRAGAGRAGAAASQAGVEHLRERLLSAAATAAARRRRVRRGRPPSPASG